MWALVGRSQLCDLMFHKKTAQNVMHEQVYRRNEAANHQLPIAVTFWIIQIVSAEECSSLTQNLMQIHCSTCSVILNATATQYTYSMASTTLNVLPMLKDAVWWKWPQLWATGDWQLHHGNVLIHAPHLVEFFVKHQIIRCLSAPIVQIWYPVATGFSQNKNHLWKGRDFRPSMRFRKIQQGSW